MIEIPRLKPSLTRLTAATDHKLGEWGGLGFISSAVTNFNQPRVCLSAAAGLDKEGWDDADTGYKDSPAHRETRDRTLPSQEQTLDTVSGVGGRGVWGCLLIVRLPFKRTSAHAHNSKIKK